MKQYFNIKCTGPGRFGLFFFLIMAFVLHPVYGQKQKKLKRPKAAHYLSIGGGWSYATLLDQAMSPLVYDGHQFSANTAYFLQKQQYDIQVEFSYDFGYLRSEFYNVNHFAQVTNTTYEGVVSYHHKIRKWMDDKLELRLGGNMDFHSGWRRHNQFSNNATNYDHILSLNASALVNYRFPLFKRDWEAGYQLYLPFFGMGLRPGYTFTNPDSFLDPELSELAQVLKGSEFTSWGEYRAVHSRLFLDYVMKNDNRFRLTYDWDYYYWNTQEVVQQGKQAVYLSVIVNFPTKKSND